MSRKDVRTKPSLPKRNDAQMPEQQNTSTSKSPLALHEFYTILRNYVQHEDELIHQRTSWNWGIQGFLFTAYGISIQKVMDASEKFATAKIGVERIYGERQLEYLIWLIPVVGIFVSGFSLYGIRVADKSIRSLSNAWSCRCESSTADEESGQDKAPTPIYQLPNLICGYDNPRYLFKLPHAFIPLMFIGVWLFLLVSWFSSK